MTIAYLCVLVAVILPYVLVGYAKFSTKNYDNRSPREFLQKLEGRAKRAHYAHLNAFESFPAFAVGVILAHIAGASEHSITILAVSFVFFRILHGICYILDQSTLRSLVWLGGFACVIGLYLLAII
ncbi:MAG: MAPEG family protein [Candidatus Omnitrophica bacterium]|nr:MAPEG family protein [Candidatus Omnitrophota bacterium]